MVHIHVTFCTPLGTSYMAESGTYEHQGTLPIWERTDCLGSPLNLSVETFNGIVGSGPTPVLAGKVHIGQSLINSSFQFFLLQKKVSFHVALLPPVLPFLGLLLCTPGHVSL